MAVYFTTVCHLHQGVLMACCDLFTLMKTDASICHTRKTTRSPPLAHHGGCLRGKGDDGESELWVTRVHMHRASPKSLDPSVVFPCHFGAWQGVKSVAEVPLKLSHQAL